MVATGYFDYCRNPVSRLGYLAPDTMYRIVEKVCLYYMDGVYPIRPFSVDNSNKISADIDSIDRSNIEMIKIKTAIM